MAHLPDPSFGQRIGRCWTVGAIAVLCVVFGASWPWDRRSWSGTALRGRPTWPRSPRRTTGRTAARWPAPRRTGWRGPSVPGWCGAPWRARSRTSRPRRAAAPSTWRSGPEPVPRGPAGTACSPSGAPRSSSVRSRTAPRLCSGSIPFYQRLGDWMQDGQPASHSQDAMACRVAMSQARAVWKARSANPAPPGWPS